ncbi:sodium/proline symporter PutP [Brevibacterium litoralis]|uniref:sodium/proline symporter PutP n=1 Tax=Brevibacterium litoralis TaxID=3138935 RepID=UPI0032EEED4E
MSETTFRTIAIILYFVGMLAIGYFAYRRSRNSVGEYMLGGRGLHPGTAALSAGASDMSGWLLLGLPGAVYMGGLIEAWMAVGLTVGAWLNWKFVAPRLRAYTELAGDSITVPSFFENRLRDSSRVLRVLCGVIILVFFTFYVSSGMVASGQFFESTFGAPYVVGMLIVSVITLAYTLFGGFLGATLTDVAQGILMLLALIAVPVVALMQAGGPGTVIANVQAAQPEALSWVAGGTALGIISAVAWGLGYPGQPHIIVRFMALRSAKEATTARRIGISWMVLASVGAVSTALVGISVFSTNPDMTLTNTETAETVFLDLAQILFHPLIAGLVLAAVLAAIMSTISSQLVVTSSALIEDLVKTFTEKRGATEARLSPKTYVWLGRGAVLLVAVVAALLSIDPADSILDLVGFAWAGFGASFGPIVLLALFWKKLTNWGTIAGLASGALVAFVWGQVDVLSSTIYEIVPGFVVNMIVTVVVSLLTRNSEVEEKVAEELRTADAMTKKA